jgi:hypothetical protein
MQGTEDGIAEILIVSPSQLEGIPYEAIYLEGSAKAMIAAFKQVIDVLESSLEYICKDAGPVRPSDCPNCDPFVHANATHAYDCAYMKYHRVMG